ncbi:MAG: UDP-N-acetylmuramoyl-L-alanine--D-glutamate ligase [Sedimenticola sp.]|nr:MAG: UDP-N-acetylmuramoyl-L-alanine--D-glutamate ligase [Sedimenticola sp.]
MKANTDQKVLIVGLGKTGLSCARFLSEQGLSVAITDSRETPPGLEQLREELPDTALFLGGFDEAAFQAADLLVVSPGVSIRHPLISEASRRGIEIIGDIELFARHVNAPVAAITGSNGKSTVTTLLGQMAAQAGRKVRVGGNLGEPALDILDPEADLYVLELSSFQLETTFALTPDAAVVLNVSADHLDRYASIDEYANAKATLYWRARYRILNRDDAMVMAMPQGDGDDLFFTLGEPGEKTFGLRQLDSGLWIGYEEQNLLPVAAVKIPGRHNLANAMAALALGMALELPMSAMLQALGEFRGLPHRTEFVAEHNGVCWYNDSKGTNVGASIAALNGFLSDDDSRTVLIAGGQAKGADFSALTPVVEASARAVVLIGEAAGLIETQLGGVVPVVHAASMDEAVARAAELARAGDRVLLSPACASFDMFRNYEHRGEMFIAAVQGLTQ